MQSVLRAGRRLAFAGLLLLSLVGGAAAVTFPAVTQGPIGKGLRAKIVDGGCTTVPCTGPQFHFFASDTPALLTECDGTGRVTIVCQPPGFDDPITIADSGSLTDANSVEAVTVACPWARARITACTSGTCVCRAWLLQLYGDF